ncbi:hypothetical protein SMICM17S_04567 [Streptomyces microflavus]
MYGSGPMYRTLKAGDKGRDVEQLERNLAALGYTGFTPDTEYTELTEAAVKRWQKAQGSKRTGKVGPQDIAFAPGKVRIKSVETAVGDLAQPGAPVLTTTGSERIVTFQLDVAESQLAKAGTEVSVDLPDGTSAPGTVSSVGRTAKPGDDPQDNSPKVTLTVSFDKPDDVGGFDQSPVTVNLTGETRKDVLTVPVNALLALPGGGFGVEVVRGSAVREVKVELGMFAEGRVEVSGGWASEGMKVGVPDMKRYERGRGRQPYGRRPPGRPERGRHPYGRRPPGRHQGVRGRGTALRAWPPLRRGAPALRLGRCCASSAVPLRDHDGLSRAEAGPVDRARREARRCVHGHQDRPLPGR